jgi:hypothetical protein
MPGKASERASALEAAAALLDLAMHESHGPIEVLGGAVKRMTEALAGYVRLLEQQRVGASFDDLAACRDAFEREIAVCVETLQFHDRLMQQLAQVRNCLAMLGGKAGDPSAQADEQSWVDLRTALWGRLTSDSQRALFDLLLPAAGARSGGDLRRINANEGSIELF